MAIIALQSVKELFFPPFHKGKVRMEVDLIQNKPLEETYELRINDTCFTMVDEVIQVPVFNEDGTPKVEEKEITYPDENGENKTEKVKEQVFEEKTIQVKKQLGEPIIRVSKKSYDDVKKLVKALQQLNPAIKKMDLDDAIIEAFRQGLYFTTKTEIEKEGLKWYGCEGIKDFEIVRE